MSNIIRVKTFGPTLSGNSSFGCTFGVLYPPIVRVQYKTTSSGGGVNTMNVVFDDAPVNNNTLVMVIGIQSGSRSVTAINQTGATWTKILHSEAPINGTRVEIWRAQNINGAGVTADIDFNGFCLAVGTLIEYSGLVMIGNLVDVSSSEFEDNAGLSKGSTGTTVLTSQDYELFVGGIAAIANITQSNPTNGFSKISDAAQGIMSLYTYEKIVSSIQSAGTVVNFSPDGIYAGVIATFNKRMV